MSDDIAKELSRIGDALTQFTEDFHLIVLAFAPMLEAINEDGEDMLNRPGVEVAAEA